jgi:hypothetical protein
MPRMPATPKPRRARTLLAMSALVLLSACQTAPVATPPAPPPVEAPPPVIGRAHV